MERKLLVKLHDEPDRADGGQEEEGLTVFEDQADGGDELAAHQHDGVVPGGLGEGLGLAVGVQDEAPAFVQQLLVV